MAFSDNAIGFYLEIEDTTFSTTLQRAQRSYDLYVKALEKYNARAFKSATSALGKIEEMIEAVSELPNTTVAALRKSGREIAKAVKPFTVKVNLDFTVTSERKLSKLVGKAVVDALTDAKIRLTQGKRMRMPPDLVGRFDLPRFEEGGIVKGPNKAFDSVMALLKPGELVLPADVTKQLTEMAGRLKDASGKFTKASGLAESLAEVDNLSKGLMRLRGALDAGLADPKEIKTYNEGVALLAKRVKDLDNETANLAYSTKVRLAPAITQARESLEKFQDQGADTGKVFENLFKKILGPARFLALHRALSDVGEVWQGIKEAGVGVFDSLGGEKIGDAIDNLNKMNSFLGLSRDGLRDVKNAAFETAAEMGAAVSVDQLTASMANLAEQGVRDVKMLTDLATVTSLAAEGMDIAADTANKFGYELTQSIGLSNEQFAGVFANIGQLSKTFNVSGQQLTEETVANVEQMGAALRQMSKEDAEVTIESMNRLGSALHSNFIAAAPEIRETLAKAFEGGPENIEAMQQAFLLTGKTTDQLRETLQSGDIGGLFDSIAERVKGLSTDQLRALSEQVGVSAGDLQKLGDSVSSLNEDLAMSGTVLVENGDALGVLQERATNNKTTFQQWATSVGNSVSNFELFGVKMGEVLDLTKEFNVAQIASIAYLGKVGIEAIGAGAKLLKGFGGVLGGLTGKLAGIGGAVTGGAGGAGIGGAITGIFTGLSAGLTALAGGVAALGAVLLSPPGIAFTVSLVATVLALGAALRLAEPAIKVWGDVAIAAIEGVVKAFGMFMPVIQTFIETAGTVLVATLDSAVEAFKAMLEVDPAHLFAIGPALISIAGGVTALAGAMGVLGAVQLGSAILSLITGGVSEGPTSFLEGLLQSIANLTVSAPEQIKNLTATVNNLGGFVLAYARLTETVRQLPTDGFFGGLFGDNAADKLTEQAGPFLDAIEKLMARTSAVQGLGQPSRVPPVNPQAIQQVVQAELAREPREELGDKLDAIVGLLERLVGLQASPPPGRTEPSAAALRAPRQGSAFSRDLAAGDH